MLNKGLAAVHCAQDVTAPPARVAFSSLVLENNPTGDVTTTLVAGRHMALGLDDVHHKWASLSSSHSTPAVNGCLHATA